ncbi:hypothetical protein PIB30_038171 [Stylosanthes scabra]|uniref:Uncharacterized protein n=1 Tax=Stylosanthes scabra TaxID=79078 RepID=A0ABU6YCX0_9FABA|nr:hypothetical protein [Stylosanthes scabra]
MTIALNLVTYEHNPIGDIISERAVHYWDIKMINSQKKRKKQARTTEISAITQIAAAEVDFARRTRSSLQKFLLLLKIVPLLDLCSVVDVAARFDQVSTTTNAFGLGLYVVAIFDVHYGTRLHWFGCHEILQLLSTPPLALVSAIPLTLQQLQS